MSRNSKPPFLPPLKLCVSEDAVRRGRSQNARHTPATDDLSDPQAGGESSRRQRSRDPSADKTEGRQDKSTATGWPEELDQWNTFEIQDEAEVDMIELEQALAQSAENVKYAVPRSRSRVRELISQFDGTSRTSSRSRMSTRGTNVQDFGEMSTLGKAKNYDSSGIITPCDDSDIELSLPDASGYNTDSSISGLLPSNEETNQSSRTHTRRLRKMEENMFAMQQQPSANINHHRNCGAESKPRLGFEGNASKTRVSRSHKSPSSPRSFLSNDSIPAGSAAAVETCQDSEQFVFKPETRTSRVRPIRETIANPQRASRGDCSTRSTSSSKVPVRWDRSPPPKRIVPSIGAPAEFGRPSRSRAYTKKVSTDVTNIPCDKATELSCEDWKPEGQDAVASLSVHEVSLQPPCEATSLPVFEPRRRAIEVEPHPPDHHHQSNGYSIFAKLKHCLSCLLSLLWAIPATAFIPVMVAASLIMRFLRCLTPCNLIGIIRSSRNHPLPSSPRQLSHTQPESQTGILNRIRIFLRSMKNLAIQGVILLIILFCLCELLVYDCHEH